MRRIAESAPYGLWVGRDARDAQISLIWRQATPKPISGI